MFRSAALVFAFAMFAPSFTWALECSPSEPGPRTLLKTSHTIFAGTVTASKNDIYSFRVTEVFKGVAASDVTVAPAPGAYPEFQIGEDYLIFAYPLAVEGKTYYFVGPCSRTGPLEYAQALLEQLRAEKSGKRVAAVYGMLVRTTDPLMGIWMESYERPLPGIVITLQSRKKKFQTKTDEHGAYAFEHLPPGSYQVSAELPEGLALGEPLKQGAPRPFDLLRHSSFDYELSAMPTGSIEGEVLGPGGIALRSTSVELFRAEGYDAERTGAYAYQGQGKPFKFYHLPPGEYILVFDRTNRPSPDAPFSRTFYPSAAILERAERIKLSDGQQLSNVDIHVANPLPTRSITIHLDWAGNAVSEFYSPQVVVTATRGQSPYPFRSGDGAYTLNLFLDARYTVRAEAFCRMPAKGELASHDVSIDAGDLATSEVNLILDQGGCTPK